MLKRAILIVQNHLRALGHFAGNPDGITGPITEAAVLKGVTARVGELPAGALGFSPERRMTMMLQLICKDKGIECEPIDGFWGPVTQNSYESLVHLIDRANLPPNWRDDEPSDANPHIWPRDRGNQQEMRNFYGPPGNPPMKKVRCPWNLKLAWDKSVTITHIGCHAKVARQCRGCSAKGACPLRRGRTEADAAGPLWRLFFQPAQAGRLDLVNACLGDCAGLGPGAQPVEMGARPGEP